MSNFKSILSTVTLCSALITSHALAQDEKRTLGEVIVTANPLERSSDKLSQPVTVLSQDNLLDKLQPTIGETLSQEPGIRSTYFGPNASRPVIRGLQGDQITILQNGIDNMDASVASVDHNVAIDPLSVEKIEVIRGPAALLYGSKAVGGVVNVIDNRIPNQRIDEKVTGVSDVRHNSVNNERAGSVLLEGGVGDYAWHFNGFKRITDNMEIPGYARSAALRASEPHDADEGEERGTVSNTQSNNGGLTVGLSRFFDKGYIGASITNYDSNYGIIGHEDDDGGHSDHEKITLDMKQQRLDIAGAYEKPTALIKEIKYKIGFSDYEHTELEGTTIGNLFKNRGYSSRVEMVHHKISNFEGALGLQANKSEFSASGEEAFIPPTETYTHSAFLFEEMDLGQLSLQIGGRLELQKIDVTQTTNFEDSKSRNDLTGNASLGLVYQLPQDYVAAISTSYSQRAPNAQELYANGAHLSTQSYEVGNQDLNVQKSFGLDLSLRKNAGLMTGEVNVFYNYFQNFITLANSGDEDTTSHLPIYNYVNLPAEFFGAELKTTFKAPNIGQHKLAFEIRGDYVEARNRKTSQHLPRISPARVGTSAIYHYQKFGFKLDVDYSFSQNNLAENETATGGYTMINAGLHYDLDVGATTSKLYVKGTNLLNEEARNHVSFLKDQIPLAGRSVMIGIRTIF